MSRTSDAAKIRGAVFRFSDRYEFSTTDVADDIGVNVTTVRLTLDVLERQGVVVQVIDSRRSRTGFRGPRWTSNPDNMKFQSRLADAEKNQDIDAG